MNGLLKRGYLGTLMGVLFLEGTGVSKCLEKNNKQ